MLVDVLVALGAMCVISAGWLAVQRLWRRHFPEFDGDDTLAARSGCANCKCDGGACRTLESNHTNQEAR